MNDSRTVVRYQVKPGRGDENAALVRAVFDELHTTAPEGIDYATYRLDDGVTFLHVATRSSAALSELAAFRAFQAGVGDRVEQRPDVTPATLVGEYRAALSAPRAAAS
jgi:hypothetical protein